MARLETLELEIVQKSRGISTKNIDKLTVALNNLALSAMNASKLTNISNALTGIVTASNNASKVPSTIKRIGEALKALFVSIDDANNAVAALDRVAAAITRISDAAQSLNGISSNIRDVTRAVNTAGNPQPNIVPSNAPETETGVAEVAAQASRASTRMNLASIAVRDFGNAVQGVCSTGLASVKGLAKGFTKLYSVAWSVAKLPLSKLGDTLTGIGKKVKNLVSSFGRIAMYRALRTAIKAITTGFSEGIKHLYQWSELTGNSFKSSMDSLATSAHYLRDSLGAMASPLIDAVAPAIEALTEKFVALLNVVNQFMAALTGKDTWRKAVRTPTTYSGAMKEAADNTRKATKAQKELHKALQGFDELNLLTTSEINARKPTSSGAGTTPEVSSTEFETKPIDDWIQAIKDAIDKGDWAGAGTLLAEKLNGMVAEWKAKEFGNKIGEKFQNGLDFYLAFMKKFEWEDLGTKIGQMFNGIFETMSAEDLGHALVAHIVAGVKLAKGFLKEAKPTFQALGVAVSTAINDLFDPDFAKEFGETIAAGVNDALIFLKTLIVGSEKILQNYDTGETITVKVGGIDFKQVGESFMTAIFTAIKTINWADLGETVAGLFTGILDAIGAGISYAATHIDEIASAIKDFAVAFFERMWKWFWPTFFEFITGGPDYQYQGGNANDRPNAPISTGQGTKTMEGFNQEVSEATDWLTEKWKWLEDHNPLNLDVTDTGNTINTQSSNVQGLNDELDHTDGTFTSEFKTKELQNRLKAVNPYAQLIDDIDGKQTSTFATSKLDEKKKAVTPYSNMIAAIGKKITTTFAVSNYKDTYDKVKALNDQLAATGKAWKITVTADLRLKPHAGSYYTIEPMAEGGFPTQGSLFVAGEVPNSAEMVGNINGKTGVASGKEITGIADAVYNTGETEAELLREQNELLRRLYSKPASVTLAPSAAAGRWVNQSQQAYARATGG